MSNQLKAPAALLPRKGPQIPRCPNILGPLEQEEWYVWACSTHKGEVMRNNFYDNRKLKEIGGKNTDGG
jgi:hypothetical protein